MQLIERSLQIMMASMLALTGLGMGLANANSRNPSSEDFQQHATTSPADAEIQASASEPSGDEKASREPIDKELLQGNKPVVRVVSPPNAGFVIAEGSDTRILVVVEIVDVTAAGIAANDRGVPRFVHPNHNVDIFLSYLEFHKKYTNHLGQEVTQLVSEIPVDALRTGDKKMSPPVNWAALSKEQRDRGFGIPMESMVDVIEFEFVVKDNNGEFSDEESKGRKLLLGVATQSFMPLPDMLLPKGRETNSSPDEVDRE